MSAKTWGAWLTLALVACNGGGGASEDDDAETESATQGTDDGSSDDGPSDDGPSDDGPSDDGPDPTDPTTPEPTDDGPGTTTDDPTDDGPETTDTPGTCGDGTCDAEETSESCCADCGCAEGSSCIEDACVVDLYCGDGACNGAETQDSCCADCGCAEGSSCIDDACVPDPYCGDAACNGAETQDDCCVDCGCAEGSSCTDGVCVVDPYCGDGACNGAETMDDCCTDCGCGTDYACEDNACVCTNAYLHFENELFDSDQYCFATGSFYTQLATAYFNDNAGSGWIYMPEGGWYETAGDIGHVVNGTQQCCMLDGCLGNLSCPTPFGNYPCICLDPTPLNATITTCGENYVAVCG